LKNGNEGNTGVLIFAAAGSGGSNHVSNDSVLATSHSMAHSKDKRKNMAVLISSDNKIKQAFGDTGF
jgi:hypothetical protein